jgi:hypothetical protein
LVASPPTILILSLVAICAVAIVWFALVIRKMLIIITAIFAPIAFAGGVADLSRGWVRKWLEAMLALVFSKLILIIIFVIGLGVLGGMGSPAGATPLSAITDEITGLLILLVAGLSPWMALRIVHFTGDHVATMSASASHASSGASTVVGAPQKAAQMKYSSMMLAGNHSRSVAPPPGSGLGPIAGGANASARTGASAGAGAAAGAVTGGATLAASAGVEAGKKGRAAAAGGTHQPAGSAPPARSEARASGGASRSAGSGPTPSSEPSASHTPGGSSAPHSASSPTQRRTDADAPAQQRAPHSPAPPASPPARTSRPVPPPPFPVTPPRNESGGQ